MAKNLLFFLTKTYITNDGIVNAVNNTCNTFNYRNLGLTKDNNEMQILTPNSSEYLDIKLLSKDLFLDKDLNHPNGYGIRFLFRISTHNGYNMVMPLVKGIVETFPDILVLNNENLPNDLECIYFTKQDIDKMDDSYDNLTIPPNNDSQNNS